VELKELILVLGRENGGAVEELPRDAAEAPHVDLLSVRQTEDNLGGPVVARLDVGETLLTASAGGTVVDDADISVSWIREE